MTFRMSWLHFALLACLLTGICFGQTPTGVPPFASTSGSSFDTVNNGNLNVHLLVPMMHKAGRGTSFDYLLSYDTSVWYPTGSSGHQNWTPVSNWGWRAVTEAETGYGTYSTSTQTCQNVNGKTTTYFQYTWIAYHDRLGVAHPMTNITNSLASQLCVSPPALQDTETSRDGSGLTFNANKTALTVTPPSGSSYAVPVLSGTGAGTFTDENGNQITATYNSTSGTTSFTDTLGTTALTTSGSGTPTSPIKYTYTSPAGTSVSYVLNYTQYTIKTNFNCGIAEYGPTSVNLVSSIALPDNSSYTFAYEATPGYAGDVTGRLASVTLPTGGTITYSYTGGNNGIVCADGSAAGLSRATPDGTWTYTRSQIAGAHWQTTINDPTTPTANQTVIAFQQDSASTANSSNFYETQRLVYQGSASGTPLSTTITCYNGNSISSPSNCPSTTISTPIKRRTIFSYRPNASGQQSETDVTYDSGGLGLVTEVDSYDFASAKVGSLIQKVITTYGNYSSGTCTALGNGIVNRPCTITVTDGGGNTQTKTTYSYDQTTPSATSGTPQHISISGSRGNITTIAYTTLGSSTISRSLTYWDTGTINVATDVNGAQTSYTYGACGNSFMTSVSEPLSLSRSVTWDCNGGVITSVTDENSQKTTISYTDAYFWRPASVTDPTGAVTTFSYATSSPYTTIESTMSFNSGNSVADVLTTVDGLGRTHLQQTKQGPSASNYDTVETDYDVTGRVSRITMPFSAAAGITNSTAPGINPTYDALGRVLTIKDANGGTVSYSYTNNDVLQKISGTQTFQKQFEYDALGRLTSVCEISSTLPGVGTCAQSNSQTGYWTKYTYDAASRLTNVAQNAQGTAQTRTYAYDGLSRLTSETNPETGNGAPGTVSYVYDNYPSYCGTGNAAPSLLQRTDNSGHITCFYYDALHRLVSEGNGNFANNTARVFVYDSATVNGVAMQNAKGRLVEAYTENYPNTTKITDEGFSYSPRGELTNLYESTLHSGGYYHTTASYWPTGALDTLGGIASVPTLYYGASDGSGLDGEGRFTKVSAASGTNPVTNITYSTSSTPNPLGALTGVTFGSSDSDSFTYDPNTGRMGTYTFSVNAKTDQGTLTWNTNGTLGKLVIANNIPGTADSQTCTFIYDDLARIGGKNANGYSVDCGSNWQQLFTYVDAFGNITKSGTSSFLPTYSSTTNQFTSIPGVTVKYDANGNLLTDNLNTYTWDADWGNMLSVNTGAAIVTATYDALGRMVEQQNGSAYTEILYSPVGKTAIMNGTNLTKAFIPLPGGGTAVYNSSGIAYYRHSDWLGSSRLASTPSRTLYSSSAYAPFGEQYAPSGTTDASFTGQNSDTASSLYDFTFREHSPSQGRWISPDPAGLLAVDPTNPQTWNRYVYVANNPLSFVDPLGLFAQCTFGGTYPDCLPDPGDLFGGGGAGGGGGGGGRHCTLGIGGIGIGDCAPPGAGVETRGPANNQINKPWSKTFPCNKSAQQVMSAVQNDMGQFADNRGTVFSAKFPDQPITTGGQYVIQPGLNTHDGGQFPMANLVVTVTSQSANGWTFTTDPSRHFFDGTVSFSSTDAGNGNVTFSVTVNANWVSPFTHHTIGPVILAGENSTWNNMLSNVQGYCQSPIGK